MSENITRTVPIDWAAAFKEAGVPPQNCRIVYLVNLKEWVLDIGDPSQILCITPPPLEPGEEKVVIRNKEWAFLAKEEVSA